LKLDPPFRFSHPTFFFLLTASLFLFPLPFFREADEHLMSVPAGASLAGISALSVTP